MLLSRLHPYPFCGAWLTSRQDLNLPRQHNDTAMEADASLLPVGQEDLAILKKYLGDATTTALVELYELIGSSGNTRLDRQTNSVKFPPMERATRANAHQVSYFATLMARTC